MPETRLLLLVACKMDRLFLGRSIFALFTPWATIPTKQSVHSPASKALRAWITASRLKACLLMPTRGDTLTAFLKLTSPLFTMSSRRRCQAAGMVRFVSHKAIATSG